jgi:hypothetical protein
MSCTMNTSNKVVLKSQHEDCCYIGLLPLDLEISLMDRVYIRYKKCDSVLKAKPYVTCKDRIVSHMSETIENISCLPFSVIVCKF